VRSSSGDRHEEEPFVPEKFDQPFWDSLYDTRPAIWSGNPNPHLVAEAEALPAGTALDVGAGEGADAIWLAARGWRVTAVDISTVALDRATRDAARAGPDVAGRIDWLHRDVMAWEPPKDHFDLVSVHFFHLAPGPRGVLFGRLASAVVVGGTLLIVGHSSHVLDGSPHEESGHRGEGSMMPIDYFFTGDEIATQLDPEEWEIVTKAELERSVADRPEGPGHTRDVVVRGVRRHSRGEGAP
jgi:SAM-dependent methyltransferase